MRLTLWAVCPSALFVLPAFTNPNRLQRAVEPLPASRPTYWWFNEVTRLVTNPGDTHY